MSAAAATLSPDPIIERLEDQIGWYDLKSASCQRWYKQLKITEIAFAAVIPLLAAFNLPHALIVTGILGVFVTIFEGLLQVNQYHENWIRYRSACDALKHEKILLPGGCRAICVHRQTTGAIGRAGRGNRLAGAGEVGDGPTAGAKRQDTVLSSLAVGRRTPESGEKPGNLSWS